MIPDRKQQSGNRPISLSPSKMNYGNKSKYFENERQSIEYYKKIINESVHKRSGTSYVNCDWKNKIPFVEPNKSFIRNDSIPISDLKQSNEGATKKTPSDIHEEEENKLSLNKSIIKETNENLKVQDINERSGEFSLMSKNNTLLFYYLSNMIKQICKEEKKTELKLDDNFDNIFRKDVNDQFVNPDSLQVFRMYPTRWIGGKIPYKISINDEQLKKKIDSAIRLFNQTKIIIFTKYERYLHDDYINFVSNENKYSPDPPITGRYPGENKIGLMNNDTVERITHSLMHALGFLHEDINNEGIYRNYSTINLDPNTKKEEFSPSIGPYYNDSIMNFPPCPNQLSTINAGHDIVRGNKAKPSLGFKLNESDINKIKYFYGKNLCTFDGFKSFYDSPSYDIKYFQPYFECKTCWGTNSTFYICVFCAEMHHLKHDKIYVNFEEVIGKKLQIMCSCGKSKHSIGCTKKISTSQMSQVAYKCKTCHILNKNMPDSIMPRICYQCSIKCHFEHEIIEGDNEKFYCGCGNKYPSPCYLQSK
ncbi:hypothetical protein SteCoe_20937 [Stentor coeruleus]|uniref:Peptidase M12A domain-containing protein n=1 Tax=Stentor coeruleus TaxID=5963 RepID=A0A1R2BR59_9CILI|nr:hypothetical protein SteCoe_20937 [Stentor coeruleus]